MTLEQLLPGGRYSLSHPSSCSSEAPGGIDPAALLAADEQYGIAIGSDHVLTKEECQEFVSHLIRWLQTGSLKPDP